MVLILTGTHSSMLGLGELSAFLVRSKKRYMQSNQEGRASEGQLNQCQVRVKVDSENCRSKIDYDSLLSDAPTVTRRGERKTKG